MRTRKFALSMTARRSSPCLSAIGFSSFRHADNIAIKWTRSTILPSRFQPATKIFPSAVGDFFARDLRINNLEFLRRKIARLARRHGAQLIVGGFLHPQGHNANAPDIFVGDVDAVTA